MTEYEKSAKNFLRDTNTEFHIQRIHPVVAKKPLWAVGEKTGHEYRVGLHRENKDPYIFSFWGSVMDRDRNQDPTAYDVLASLSTSYEMTLDEFVDEFGASKSYERTVEQWRAVQDESRSIRRLFNEDELAQLTDIQ